MLLSLVAAALVAPVLSGPVLPDTITAAESPAPGQVAWFEGTFEEALALAASQDRLVFVDFWTDWCVWCKRLDADVFSQESVATALDDLVCLSVDAESKTGAPVAKRFNVLAFPTLLVPGGLKNPIVRKLGILTDETKPRNNVLMLRPDGSIAVALSGLTMSAQKGSVVQNVIELHDEKMVDEALARGDLEEAKRLAFAHAPIDVPAPEGEKKKKPVRISNPHLRSRAKVYLAMGDLKAALADAEQAYLAVNIAAGYISMRTDELEETEALKATILTALKQAESKN